MADLQPVWTQNLIAFIEHGLFSEDEKWQRIFVEQLSKISAPQPAPSAALPLTAPPARGEVSWRKITEEDRPPNDVNVIMGCWQKWPTEEWIVEYGLYGSTKGGWIHGRMTHWLPSSIIPSSPALASAEPAPATGGE